MREAVVGVCERRSVQVPVGWLVIRIIADGGFKSTVESFHYPICLQGVSLLKLIVYIECTKDVLKAFAVKHFSLPASSSLVEKYLNTH